MVRESCNSSLNSLPIFKRRICFCLSVLALTLILTLTCLVAAHALSVLMDLFTGTLELFWWNGSRIHGIFRKTKLSIDGSKKSKVGKSNSQFNSLHSSSCSRVGNLRLDCTMMYCAQGWHSVHWLCGLRKQEDCYFLEISLSSRCIRKSDCSMLFHWHSGW